MENVELPSHHPKRRAVSVASYIMAGILPPVIPQELWWPALTVCAILFIYGISNDVGRIHSAIKRKVEAPFEWAVWGLMMLVGGAVIFGAWRLIERYRYHLQYEVCFNHVLAQGTTEPMLSQVWVWPRYINDNRFAIKTELEEASLQFGKYASDHLKLPQRMLITPHAPNAAIVDLVEFKPPIPATMIEGNARYVVRYGTDASNLNRTLVIKGRVSGGFTPDGRGTDLSFTPENESDADFIPKPCVIRGNGVSYEIPAR